MGKAPSGKRVPWLEKRGGCGSLEDTIRFPRLEHGHCCLSFKFLPHRQPWESRGSKMWRWPRLWNCIQVVFSAGYARMDGALAQAVHPKACAWLKPSAKKVLIWHMARAMPGRVTKHGPGTNFFYRMYYHYINRYGKLGTHFLKGDRDKTVNGAIWGSIEGCSRPKMPLGGTWH